MNRSLNHLLMQPSRHGCVVATAGCVATVAGLHARVGDVCRFAELDGHSRSGEVMALQGQHLLVWVASGVQGLGPHTRVSVKPEEALLPVGDTLLGRVISPYGVPMDGKGPLGSVTRVDVQRKSPEPMGRRRVRMPFETRVRVLDGLLALGVGQRVGIVAPAGAGKTTLLGMLARHCASDVNVIGLVGERGREVREFVEESLGEHGLGRSVVVCATSDASPIERYRAALAATTVAEHFRDQGRHVLLMIDSLTRFARAQRELGLAQGEPPTRRGYPTSLFTVLPALIERAGPGPEASGGDITALYTLLMEDAEMSDPLVEEAKSLLDGHIVLSRELASAGQFPAIDVRQSISRLMSAVMPPENLDAANRVREWLAKRAEVLPLVQMGEFVRGEDAEADRALDVYEPLRQWMRQAVDEPTDAEDARLNLLGIVQ